MGRTKGAGTSQIRQQIQALENMAQVLKELEIHQISAKKSSKKIASQNKKAGKSLSKIIPSADTGLSTESMERLKNTTAALMEGFQASHFQIWQKGQQPPPVGMVHQNQLIGMAQNQQFPQVRIAQALQGEPMQMPMGQHFPSMVMGQIPVSSANPAATIASSSSVNPAIQQIPAMGMCQDQKAQSMHQQLPAVGGDKNQQTVQGKTSGIKHMAFSVRIQGRKM